MKLPQDLIELLSAFADAGVRYLLVGGHAVAAHGKPRSTKDIDLWLASDADNIERACSALTRFGLPPELVAALRGAGPEDIVWVGRPPTRVDLLLSLPALDFEDAWGRKLTLELSGVPVSVVGKADLIRNKQAVGRPQDLRDVKALLGQSGPRKAEKPRPR
jgi:hypothetical protein